MYVCTYVCLYVLLRRSYALLRENLCDQPISREWFVEIGFWMDIPVPINDFDNCFCYMWRGFEQLVFKAKGQQLFHMLQKVVLKIGYIHPEANLH